MKNLTLIQATFVAAMLEMDEKGRFPTATAAYASLHPDASVKSAAQIACRLMKRGEVRRAIQQGRAAALSELIETLNIAPIANQAWRILEAQRKYDQLEQLLVDRAARRSAMLSETGLEISDYRGKAGEMEIAVFDKDLVDAMRELREEVAKETGAIVKRIDLTSGGQPIGLSDAELDAAIKRAEGGEISQALPA